MMERRGSNVDANVLDTVFEIDVREVRGDHAEGIDARHAVGGRDEPYLNLVNVDGEGGDFAYDEPNLLECVPSFDRIPDHNADVITIAKDVGVKRE